VIHTVGPVYGGRPSDAERLASALRSSLRLAVDHDVGTVAFPAISCGVYGYPADEAAALAASVVAERAWALEEIRFVLFSKPLFDVFRKALRR
jgi:O-acetyl-ADP-ribose deacetylase (regulator of RNase III)